MSFTAKAAGQGHKQTVEHVSLAGTISADWDLGIVEVTRRLQRAWACFGQYEMEMYGRPGVRPRLNVRMLKAEVIETPNTVLRVRDVEPEQRLTDCDRLRKTQHQTLLRCLGRRKRKREGQTLSYVETLL